MQSIGTHEGTYLRRSRELDEAWDRLRISQTSQAVWTCVFALLIGAMIGWGVWL